MGSLMKSTIGALSLIACLCIAPTAVGQKPAGAAKAAEAAYVAPRNSLGQPDLEGIWTQNFIILMEA